MSTLQRNLQSISLEVETKIHKSSTEFAFHQKMTNYKRNRREIWLTSNSGTRLWDSAMVFKSLSQGPIRGLGGAAHPGFPPCSGTSPSSRWGTPFERNNSQPKLGFRIPIHFRNEVKRTQKSYRSDEQWEQDDSKRQYDDWRKWPRPPPRRWAPPIDYRDRPQPQCSYRVAVTSHLD